MQRRETDVGALIASSYLQFMDVYDEDLASVATAAVINELLVLDAPCGRAGAASCGQAYRTKSFAPGMPHWR